MGSTSITVVEADSVAAIAAAIARGERTCAAVAETCLARAAAVEDRLRAFAWLDATRVRAAARALDQQLAAARAAGEPLPPLAGVPVGIKDIVDTAGIPTECGSPLFAGRVPDTSATLVACLQDAGALIFGKTVTTECAFFHPGPTRNPWDLAHTPGGSSMGSAAAVAAGVIPAAAGTQTNGSIIRPAAFCGVVGFKPTAGRIATAGVLRFSGTLDTMGGFARTVEDVARLCAAMAGEPLHAWWDGASSPLSFLGRGAGAEGHLGRETRGESHLGRGAEGDATPLAGFRFAVARTAEWPHAEPAMQARFAADLAALAAAGATLEEVTLPGGLDDLAQPVHRTIMQREGADSLGALVAQRPDLVSETLRTFLEGGARIPVADYHAALRERSRLITAFLPWATSFDAILTPPAPGEAPPPETTGDPRFCTRWTLLGAPALTLPTGFGPYGLPLGLQLVGAPSDDRRVLRAAAAVERVAAITPGAVTPAGR